VNVRDHLREANMTRGTSESIFSWRSLVDAAVPGKPRWVDARSGRPITPHGLRSTFRTWGEDTGFARDLLEEALGHQIGTSVERAYRRTEQLRASSNGDGGEGGILSR
jgi:integrase